MSDEATNLMEILDQHLAVRDAEGVTRLQGVLLATVYFEEPWRREAREAVVVCYEDYRRRCGDRLRWAMSNDANELEPFGGPWSNPREWLLGLGEDRSFLITCHSAEHGWGAGAFCFEALGMERRPYLQLGYVRVSFPLLWFAQAPGSLPEVLLELCRKIKPVSGYGGIGVMDSPDCFSGSEYSPVVYQWAQRLPGLEVDYSDTHALWLLEGRGGKPGIKGVNWLTVLGDAFVTELGGADRVEADVLVLDSRFVVRRFEGGLLIQAGPKPQLGDAKRDLWPELYVKLSKYLKPIRITEHRPFQMGGPGERFTKDRSEAWLRRFDDR